MVVRFLRVFLLIVVLASLWAGVAATQAQTSTPTELPSTTETPAATPGDEATPAAETDPALLRLDRLGIKEESLDGPFDARYLSIRLPADWRLESGALLQLDFVTFIGGSGTSTSPAAQAAPATDGTATPPANQAASGERVMGGSLDVQFNGVTLGRIFLDQTGSRLVTLPISDTALISTRADGSHTLAFLLDAGLTCTVDRQTSVLVRSSTVLNLPHVIEAPQPSLATLPRPIFQESPLQPDVAALIVPDQPSADELQAALTVSAKFGSLSSGRLNLPLLTESAITPTLRSEANLVFVGKTASFKSLAAMELPAPAKSGKFASQTIQASDGVIQIARSPWADDRVALLISGDDDAAVVKSGQAFSAGTVRSIGDPALSVVSEIHSSEALTATADLQLTKSLSEGIPIERTLADLGYDTRTSTGLGAQFFDYAVELPAGYELSQDGYFDMLFAHSSLLDYDVSGLLVRLNDQPISTVRLNDDTARNGNTRVVIPRASLKHGKNKLTLSANLIPSTPCVDPSIAGIWISIRSESLLHLPLRPVGGQALLIRKLNNFFDPYVREGTMNNVAFVLPGDDAVSWNVAAQIAADLGDRVDGPFTELRAVFNDQSATISATHDLIVVGQPKALPLVAGLGATLPAPFEAGKNHPVLGNSRVIYRIPEDLSLGYLEIARSPWNDQRTILGVFGSSDEGLRWAGDALAVPALRAKLGGTVAVVNKEQVSVEDPTLTNDTSTLGGTITPPDQSGADFIPVAPIEKPRWILYAIGGTLVAMWLILLFVGVRAWRNRHRRA